MVNWHDNNSTDGTTHIVMHCIIMVQETDACTLSTDVM